MPKTKAFIEKARAKHGERYDYSKVVYVHSKGKVIITCKIHGDFEQQAGSHLSGCNCSKCAGQYSPSTAEWVAIAEKAHNERYDYSKVDYVNSVTKVIIICKKHGEFHQEAGRHVREKFGCPKCVGYVDGVDGFILKAKECHGDRYDYSETVYHGSRERLKIKCRVHGFFEQFAGSHTTGSGCGLCADINRGRKSRSNIEDFIAKAKEVHGDIYSYANAVYITNNDKLSITCKSHGVFEQSPSSHLSGGGCPKCAGRGLSTKEWIARCVEKHGETYLYDKTEYLGAQKKSIITCRIHGDFKVRLVDHCSGIGCLMCGRLATNKAKIDKSKDSFVRLAMLKHGNKYSYASTVYVKANEAVTITCRIHGHFKQTPAGHLSGSGCRECGYLAGVEAQIKEAMNSFVEKANNIHSNRYTYAKVDYVRARFKVVITCAEHGDFKQAPNKHLNGRGCPRCFWDRDQPTAVYLMQMGAQVKIGVSIDPETRLAQLNRKNPKPAHIINTWTLEDFPTAHAMEQRIHRKLAKYHAGLSGFDGASEWFNTTPDHAEQVVKKLLFATMHNSATITSKATQMDLFT